MTNAAHRTQLTRFDREGRALRTSETSALFILVSVVATLGVVAYSMFLLNPANRGDFLPYALVIIAESVLVVQALLSMWTILSSGYEPIPGFGYYCGSDLSRCFARRLAPTAG